jgi:hypothetical protein
MQTDWSKSLRTIHPGNNPSLGACDWRTTDRPNIFEIQQFAGLDIRSDLLSRPIKKIGVFQG